MFILSVLVPDTLLKVTSFEEDNVITEADTGQELFEMLNDAIYEYLDIPTQYRELLGYYLPPENVREELKVAIPDKYLNKRITASA
jgi:predicted RNase H-like HicB family nuclease